MITQQDIAKFYTDLENMQLVNPGVAMMAASGLKSSGTVSDYLNKKKKPSEKFIKAFYDKIYKPSPKTLSDGVGGSLPVDVDIKLSDYISLLKEKATKAEERERAYQKLVEKTLETNNTSLHGLLIGQKSILAHLEVGFEKEAMMEAGGDKKKAAKIKDETGRRIVEVLEEVLNSGSWVDRPHPGNQQKGA